MIGSADLKIGSADLKIARNKLSPMRIIARSLLLFTFLCATAELSSQPARTDSTFSQYDSIQDHRLDLIRQRTLIRMERLEREKAELTRTVDSLAEVQDSLGEHLLRLENNHRELSEQYLQLQQQMDRVDEASTAYREKLRRNLWLAGTLMLLFFTGLFIYLFLYTVKIRNMLQRQVKSVRSETEKAVRKMRKRQKRMEKRTRKELTRKLRALKNKRRTR